MPWLIAGLVLALFVVVVVVWVVKIYNRLVQLRERCKNAFSQIDVQLKRRHDLIPNLVETAKGYMKHERETLEAVIRARTAAVDGLKQAAADPTDPAAMQRLAEAEQVTSPTMTRIVDGLERVGLAVRLPHPDDRRAVRVEATAEGRRVMERGRRQRVAVLSAVLGRLSADELAAVDRASAALAAALEAEQRPGVQPDA